MNYTGLIIGAATFLIIGLFHPIVIKAEYHFGTKCWWVFALAGILFVAASLWVASFIWSTLLGVIAFSSFWSILELFEQKKRVEKGWFPKKSVKRWFYWLIGESINRLIGESINQINAWTSIRFAHEVAPARQWLSKLIIALTYSQNSTSSGTALKLRRFNDSTISRFNNERQATSDFAQKIPNS